MSRRLKSILIFIKSVTDNTEFIAHKPRRISFRRGERKKASKAHAYVCER